MTHSVEALVYFLSSFFTQDCKFLWNSECMAGMYCLYISAEISIESPGINAWNIITGNGIEIKMKHEFLYCKMSVRKSKQTAKTECSWVRAAVQVSPNAVCVFFIYKWPTMPDNLVKTLHRFPRYWCISYIKQFSFAINFTNNFCSYQEKSISWF